MSINGKVENPMSAQILDFQPQKAGAPTPVNGNVPPKRIANSVRRPREHLSPHEVESLIEAARKVGRHQHRDGTMILIAYRHGLRVSELIALSRIGLKTSGATR